MSDRSESSDSLPRQSVMPRRQVASEYSGVVSGSDYQPSNAEESVSSSRSSSNDDSEDDDSIKNFIVTLPTKHTHKTVKFESRSSSSDSMTSFAQKLKSSRPTKSGPFNIKCFYKESEVVDDLNGPRRRRAAMNVRYRADSDSDNEGYSDDQGKRRFKKAHESDSEFEVHNAVYLRPLSGTYL